MRIIKYLINLVGSGFLTWKIFYSFKLWVLPPIGNSKKESFELLERQIIEIGMENLTIAILVILFLAIITWGIQRKIELRQNNKELFLIFSLNCLIATIAIAWGIIDAYKSLVIEIENNF